MLRNIIIGLISATLGGALIVLAQWLYRNDIEGVRTAVAKRYPVSHEREDLSEQSFERAFLPYANFGNTKLHETMLSDANLQYADFSGADFEMAGLSEKLRQCHFSWGEVEARSLARQCNLSPCKFSQNRSFVGELLWFVRSAPSQ